MRVRKELATKLLEALGVEEIEFTCDNCPDRDKCKFAYDPYCTGGDCLATK